MRVEIIQVLFRRKLFKKMKQHLQQHSEIITNIFVKYFCY